jgi:glycolate oxidase
MPVFHHQHYLLDYWQHTLVELQYKGRLMINSSQIELLRKILGADNVLLTREDLLAYSYDATNLYRHTPDVVVLPQTTEQVSQVLKLANEQRIPVTARGGGTNVSGGSIPVKGGIVLCTARMNRIISINKATLVAEVEPGVVLQYFNEELAKEGLFYPPDPQSAAGCTLGGTIAENAGGPYGVKYGVTRHYLLGLEVVLATGEIVKLGGQTIKNRMGYELAALFVGSEGTLGIVTRITVRLLPLPKSQTTMLAVFENMETAGEAVSHIIAARIIPAKIEFVDNWFIRRIEEVTHLGLPVEAEALLLVQCDGDPQAVASEIEQVVRVCLDAGAREARPARDEAEAGTLWQVRRSAFGILYSSAPTVLSEDITVPRDKIAPLIKRCYQIGNQYNFQVHFTGHAGDGNIHPSIQTDVNDRENFSRALRAMDDMMMATLELGGVISGEHGIGLEKQRYMKRAMDSVALRMMRDIKHLLDPNGILNPGKIWED